MISNQHNFQSKDQGSSIEDDQEGIEFDLNFVDIENNIREPTSLAN